MVIKEIANPTTAVLPSTKSKQGSSSGIEFQKILEGAVVHGKQVQQASPSEGAAQGIEINPRTMSSQAGLIALFGTNGPGQAQTQAVESMDCLIGLMERYQQAIANPQIPLKKIEPFVQSLSQEVARLDLLSQKLPPSDPLQKMMTEARVISSLEVEKFYRGDYL